MKQSLLYLLTLVTLMITTNSALGSVTQGPLPDVQLWPTDQPILADTDVGSQGSLSFWFLLEDGLYNGPTTDPVQYELVTGAVRVILAKESRFISLQLQSGPDNPMPNLRLLLPGLPGPGWYHLAFEWDAAAGYVNAYVNGTKVRHTNESIGTWDPIPVTKLHFSSPEFTFADPQLRPRRIDPEELKYATTQYYYGSTDLILGARSLGTLNVKNRRGELIYESSFADPASVADWIIEGDALLSFEDGWMTMASQRPDGVPEHGHFVFWNPMKMPDSFIAEWEFQPTEIYGLCIVFFAATGPDGQSIFDPQLQPRNGHFPQYHSGDIHSYHISYFANTPNEPGRATSNLRKNSGFYLVANGPPGVPFGSLNQHRITLIKEKNHIRMAVDGQLIIDWIDQGSATGPALGAGVIGLRQMQWTIGRYRNFKVYNLIHTL